MPGIRSKKSKVKRGFMPAYSPRLRAEPTEEANIPLWQPDGSVKYVDKEGFNWMVDNKLIDLPRLSETKEDPPSNS